MSKNKVQHYLPAFYIYNFTNNEQRARSKEKRKTCVFHYDFRKKSLKERPIEKIATESYLLSYKDNNGLHNHELDIEVQNIENKASSSLQELNDIYEFVKNNKTTRCPINNEIIDNIIDLILWQIRRHPDLINDFEEKCEKFLNEEGFAGYDAKKMALSAVKEIESDDEYDIKDELGKKNKTIIFTTSKDSHFITTDKPFVRFNKHSKNGIAVPGTEMYYPLSSNMLLFMHGNGNNRSFIPENDRVELRKLNTYIARHAGNYLIGKSDNYLNRILKNVAKE